MLYLPSTVGNAWRLLVEAAAAGASSSAVAARCCCSLLVFDSSLSRLLQDVVVALLVVLDPSYLSTSFALLLSATSLLSSFCLGILSRYFTPHHRKLNIAVIFIYLFPNILFSFPCYLLNNVILFLFFLPLLLLFSSWPLLIFFPPPVLSLPVL